MDEFKFKAGEKFEALHVAAKTAADNSKTRVNDAILHTSETYNRFRDAILHLWRHELIVESRQRVSEWSKDAVRRIKEGTPPLSPIVLYEELVALFKDRVWRRSMLIFALGAALGGGAGFAVGLRAARPVPSGPPVRALHSDPDHGVTLVEDAVAKPVGTGDVLVRVQAFSVCAIDRAVLRGHGAVLRSLVTHSPLSVGRGFAGVVLDVGRDVEDLELGDEVWGCVSEWSGGAAAELLTVRSTRVSKRPRGLAADVAAAAPWAGSLALLALSQLQYSPENCKGKRVAVVGAGGGEGCALVQLLSRWGAHVTVLAPRHSAMTLQELGAKEFVDVDWNKLGATWTALEQQAARAGPWDGVVVCGGTGAPPPHTKCSPTVLKATAPRDAIVDVRARAFLSDRLPAPFSFIFAVTFCTFRVFRWVCGHGTHTDWLEDRHRLRPGLEALRQLMDGSQLVPTLDKVYLPQDFESALAHACSEDALGTSVIRFP